MIKFLRDKNLAFIFLIISTTIVVLLYLILRGYENQSIIFKSKTESLKRKVVIEDHINESINGLKLLQIYFQKNQIVSRSEFSKVVQPLLKSNSNIQAIEWIPRVMRENRATFEMEVRNEGYENFYIKEFFEKGTFRKAVQREFYYPIYFIEPFVSNECVFGVDIGIYSFTKRNLEPIIEKNGLAISSGLKLIQDSTGYGFVIYLPVYAVDKPKTSNNFLGFIAGVYKTSKLIEYCLDRFPKDVGIRVLDKLSANDRFPIYTNVREDSLKEFINKSGYRQKYYNAYNLNIENLDWVVEFYDIPQGRDNLISLHPFFYGLIIVLLVTVFLFLLQRYSSKFRVFNSMLTKEISQRILFEKELSRSEEKFSKLFYTSPIPITFIRLSDRTLVDVNYAFEKKFGYAKTSILGKTTKELGIWVSDDTWESYYDVFYSKGEVVYLEAQVKTISGDVITCILSGSLIPLQGEDYMFTYYQDITESKNAENELKQSEEKYRDIFNSVSDAIFIYDTKTNKLEDVNLSACEMYKYSKDELLNMDIRELPSNDYPYSNKELKNYFLSSTKTKRSVVKEWLAKDMNGDSFWVEISYAELLINGQKKILSVVRDITERKKTESLLKENEFLFRTQFNNSNIGIAIATPEGYLIRANKKICDTLGYTESELQELHRTEYSDSDDIEEENILLKRVISGEIDNYEVDKKFLKKNGERLSAHISVSCLRNPDMTIHYLIVHVFDLTDRVEMEKKIFKAIIDTEENERARFAQELHDGLGPILSSIRIYTQWMAKPYAKIEISKAISEIDGLLDVANSSVREIASGLSPHVLRDFGLYEALKSFTSKIKGENVPFISIYCNLTNRIDEAAETVIYRVLIECVNNSIKHSSAQNIDIKIERVDNILSVDYVDDGIGFDIADVDSINKGMGLYNIKNRIKTLNGDIVINSSLGKGTSIKISIKI